MKFAKVDKNGVYRPPVHSKLSYGSMVKLRAGMVPDAGWKLAQAATVAVRYCTVRRQFQPANLNKADAPNNAPESQVISYSGLQHRLFPLISVAYGLIITGFSVTKLFDEMTEQLESENATLLPQVHVLTCGLKSWGTRRSCDGIEEVSPQSKSNLSTWHAPNNRYSVVRRWVVMVIRLSAVSPIYSLLTFPPVCSHRVCLAVVFSGV